MPLYAAMLLVLAPQSVPVGCATVPVSLLKAADLHVMSVAQMLVEARCSVGLEIRRQDHESFATSKQRWNPWTMNREHFDVQSRAPVQDFLSAFNASQESYSAEVMDGIVLLRPRSGRAMYLESRPLTGVIQARGLMIMMATLTAAMEGRVLSGGIAASDISPVGVEVDRATSVEFSVNADGKTVLEVLSAVAQQAAPRGWLVITSGGGSPRIED